MSHGGGDHHDYNATNITNTTHGEAHGEEHGATHDAHDAAGDFPLVFFCFAMSVGILVSMGLHYVPRKVRPPYTVVLFLAGVAVSRASSSLGGFGDAIESVKSTHPHTILFYLLPPLLFESANSIDFHVFITVVGQCLTLAVPGVAFCVGLVALLFKYVFFTYQFAFTQALLVASIVAATDPVAVVATLQTLGAPKSLSILIEGESLLNDGSAFVLFLIFKGLADGGSFNFWHSVGTFVRLSFGGPAWGLACALALAMWLASINRRPICEIAVCILAVFSCFYLAENILEVSGVLAVVVLGLYMSTRGKYKFSPETPHKAHQWWEFVAFSANTVLFVLAGVIVEDKVVSQHTGLITYVDWLFLGVHYIALHVFRAIMLVVFWCVMAKGGYRVSVNEAAMMVFSGLRGAVGLALGLIVELDPELDPAVRSRINFHVSGIVMLTMLINGTFAEFVYKKLKISKPNPLRNQMLRQASERLEEEATKAKKKLQLDWLYRQAQWGRVDCIVPNLSQDCDFSADTLTWNPPSLRVIFSEKEPDAIRVRNPRRRKLLSPQERAATMNIAKDFVLADFLEPLGMRKYMATFQAQQIDYKALLQLEAKDLLEMGIAGSESEPKSDMAVILRQISILRDKKTGGNSRVQMYSNFFNAVSARYRLEYRREYLSQRSIVMLLASVDAGMDHLHDDIRLRKNRRARDEGAQMLCPLTNEYETLEQEVKIPQWLNILLDSQLFRWIGLYFYYFHLRAAVEALVGYIHVHEKVIEVYERDHPHFYSMVKDKVAMAEELLESMELRVPMFTCVIHTLFSVRIVLHKKKKTLEHLVNKGLLTVKDAEQMAMILDNRLRNVAVFHPIGLSPEAVIGYADDILGCEVCELPAEYMCEACDRTYCQRCCEEAHEPGYMHSHELKRLAVRDSDGFEVGYPNEDHQARLPRNQHSPSPRHYDYGSYSQEGSVRRRYAHQLVDDMDLSVDVAMPAGTLRQRNGLDGDSGDGFGDDDVQSDDSFGIVPLTTGLTSMEGPEGYEDDDGNGDHASVYSDSSTSEAMMHTQDNFARANPSIGRGFA